MKNDVLTLAAVLFVIGLLVSGFISTDVFDSNATPAGGLQQGTLAQ